MALLAPVRQRPTRVGIVVVLASAVVSLLSPAIGEAAWGRSHILRGRTLRQIAFDPHGGAWAVAVPGGPDESSEPARSYLGRLTRSFTLSQTRSVPAIPGGVTRVERIAVNGRGEGVLLLDYETDLGSEVHNNGVAVAGWRLAGQVGSPTILARDSGGMASAAIGPSTAVAAWSDPFGPSMGLHIARFQNGSVTGLQRVASGGGAVQLAPAGNGRLRALWLGQDRISLAPTVEESTAGRDGVFGRPLAVPRPADAPLRLVLGSNGAQLALWDERPPRSRGEYLYVAARRAGHRFGPPRRLGLTAYSQPAVAISPRGRLTIVWNAGYDTRLLVASGYVGGPLRVEPLRRGARLQEEGTPMLSINSRGEAIALWTDSHGGSAVLAATSEDGLHFSTPHRLSVSGGGIRGCATGERGLLATGPHGEAIAGWSCERGGASVQELARFVP